MDEAGHIPPESASRGATAKGLKLPCENDVFTFARLTAYADRAAVLAEDEFGTTTRPEADLNLIYRLYQVTSLKIQPGLHFINIIPEDSPYPFVYLAAAGRLVLSSEEVTALHSYSMNGGFLMADDFWGDDQCTFLRAN